MGWLRQFIYRLRAVFRRREVEAELADEVQAHLDMATEAHIAAGMSPEEARYAARREFGGVEQVKERYRDERCFVGVDQLAGDLRLALRSLLRAWGFSLTVLLIVALCLGANVVIFSIVNSSLLRPLPFRDPGRLVTVFNSYPKAGVGWAGVSVPHYLERRAGIVAFEDSALIRGAVVAAGDESAPYKVNAPGVTPSFFRVLGVDAALGRTFTDDEGVYGSDHVVILSDAFWREHFNGDRSVVGRTLRLAKAPYTVIGVMPTGFHYLAYDASLWLPLCFSADDRRNDLRHGGGGEMISRLRRGATLAEAQAQIDALNERTIKTDPLGKAVLSVGFHTTVLGLHAFHVAGLRPVLLLLQTAVLVLFLIGTVNLANLLMVRATSRAREFMLRQILGAGRIQLVRTILAETLLLSLAGGMLGIGVGAAAIRGMVALAASRIPSDVLPRLDPTVCFAALGASGVLSLLLALPVIWLTAHRSPAASLSVESRGGTTTRAVHRLRHTLIVAQVALAVVLLSCAGFLGLSFKRVLDVKPGFERENLLTGAVALPQDGYKEPGQRLVFIGRLESAARSMPGVRFATISNGTPFSGRVWGLAWFIAGATPSSDEFVKEAVYTYFVTGDYFATLGVPLREGRLLTDDDYRLAHNVCVIDEEFARRHWPAGGALGHRMVLPIDPKEAERQFVTIVGVVGSVKQDDLADRANHAAVYFPLGVPSEFPVPSDFMVTVRTQLAPGAAGPDLRAAVVGVDRAAELYDLKTMDTRVGDSLVDRRTPLILAGIFAGVSLALTVVGLYGVLSFSVAQRRREIGVRMALGARPGQILGQFVGMGLGLLGVGLPLGLLGAWLAGRALASALFGVTPASPLVLCCTAGLLAAVAMPACLLPSRRAARVAPAEALRSD